jgi:hypothetical protein
MIGADWWIGATFTIAPLLFSGGRPDDYPIRVCRISYRINLGVAMEQPMGRRNRTVIAA